MQSKLRHGPSIDGATINHQRRRQAAECTAEANANCRLISRNIREECRPDRQKEAALPMLQVSAAPEQQCPRVPHAPSPKLRYGINQQSGQLGDPSYLCLSRACGAGADSVFTLCLP